MNTTSAKRTTAFFARRGAAVAAVASFFVLACASALLASGPEDAIDPDSSLAPIESVAEDATDAAAIPEATDATVVADTPVVPDAADAPVIPVTQDESVAQGSTRADITFDGGSHVGISGNRAIVDAALADTGLIEGCESGACPYWQVRVERQVGDSYAYFSSDVHPATQHSSRDEFALPDGTYTKIFLVGLAGDRIGYCGDDNGDERCPDGKAGIDEQFGILTLDGNEVSFYPFSIAASGETLPLPKEDIVVADIEVTVDGETLDVVATGGEVSPQSDAAAIAPEAEQGTANTDAAGTSDGDRSSSPENGAAVETGVAAEPAPATDSADIPAVAPEPEPVSRQDDTLDVVAD